MWIVPAPCEISPFWDTTLSSRLFVLQRSKSSEPSLWTAVLGTLQAMFDVRQAPFRILLKTNSVDPLPGDHAVTIAVAQTRADIEKDWNWLEERLIPETEGLESYHDIAFYVCSKIESIISQSGRNGPFIVAILAIVAAGTDEITADDRFRVTARSFRQIFGLPDSERLVNYYSCSCAQAVISQGWMYLSEHYLAYYSFILGIETKVLIEVKKIVDIRKENSKRNLVPDSIRIVTSDGQDLYFSNLFHRDDAYDLIQELVNRAMQKVLRAATTDRAPGLADQDSVSGTVDFPISSPSPRKTVSVLPKLGTPAPLQTFKEGLDRQKQNIAFQTIFRLPSTEEILLRVESVFWVETLPEDRWKGELVMSSHFICFLYQPREVCTLALPLCAVSRMVRVVEEQNSASGEIKDPYAIALTTCHQQTLYLTLGYTLKQCNNAFTLLKELLLANLPLNKNLCEFVTGFVSESMMLGEERSVPVYQGFGVEHGFPSEDPRREKVLKEYWINYFTEYGRNMTIVKTPYFAQLVKIGLPHSLRGEIWELCCGAAFERLADPEAYQRILRLNAGKTSFSTAEIEKDLSRSLPEYGAYKTTDGIDALRRVLHAYSFHNPELGYCQAMNIVTSALLIYLNEEQTFFVLRYLCEIALPEYYSTNMFGVAVDQDVFEALVQKYLRIIWQHFIKKGIKLSMASTSWFLTLFLNTMPMHLAFRVLDWFFYDGSKVLFQIGLAVLKITGEELLTARDEGEIVKIFGNYFVRLDEEVPRQESADNLFHKRPLTNFQKLILVANREFGHVIDASMISELRQQHQLKVARELEDFARRTIVRELMDQVKLTRETLNFYYDQYQSVLFYSQATPAASHEEIKKSVLLDLEKFAHFWTSIAPWAVLDGEPSNAVKNQSAIQRSSSANSQKLRLQATIDRAVKALFINFDTDQSDGLSFSQVAIGLDHILNCTLLERIRLVFDLYDEDHDGNISHLEVVAISELILVILRDQEGDEHLTAVSEFIRACFTNDSVDTTTPDSIGFKCFLEIVIENPYLNNFFAVEFAKAILQKPVGLKKIQERPGLASLIWNAMSQLRPFGFASGSDSPKATKAASLGTHPLTPYSFEPQAAYTLTRSTEDVSAILEGL